MYQGYLAYGDTEIANHSRLSAYLDQGGAPSLRSLHPAPELHQVLGDDAYTSPEVDGAPWYVDAVPESGEFYGFCITRVQGIGESTTETSASALLTDGSVLAPPHAADREIRVRGLLVATTQEGLEYGAAWLLAAVDLSPCGGYLDCPDRSVVFYTAPPRAEDPTYFRRTMYGVGTLSGLRTIREFSPSRGAMREVEFVLVAGIPWQLTDPVSVVTSTGLTGTPGTAEVACPALAYDADDLVLDPNNPALAAPPAPPDISVVTVPSTWTRYVGLIPASISERWGRLFPIIWITTTGAARRNVRVRFYRDTNGIVGLDVPECDFLGEALLTYMPANSTVAIDARTRNVTISVNGAASQPAGHLVLATGSRPLRWPVLTCHQPYTVVIDSEAALTGTTVLITASIGE